ncbi:MAG: DUF483 domain-containing protein [Nanoarchaeota archaeon]|nr:DUF483 domain-containing protein [Nanoarchaeota archaeon]
MKNIYKSEEWINLELNVRSDLVPAIEEVRHGAQIEFWRSMFDNNREEQINYLEYSLKKIGINYRTYELDYYISWEESWLDKLWGKVTPEGKVIHEINHGQFLGYPQCCIDNFEASCETYLQGKGLGPMAKFWQDAKKAMQEGKFNESLFYVLHAPCSLCCKETIKMAEEIKKVLNFNDTEAGEYLKLLNQKNILNIKIK